MLSHRPAPASTTMNLYSVGIALVSLRAAALPNRPMLRRRSMQTRLNNPTKQVITYPTVCACASGSRRNLVWDKLAAADAAVRDLLILTQGLSQNFRRLGCSCSHRVRCSMRNRRVELSRSHDGQHHDAGATMARASILLRCNVRRCAAVQHRWVRFGYTAADVGAGHFRF
jgi:hypothetical protein